MLQIDGITDEPRQNFKIPVVDSEIDADMTLTWKDTQSSWFMDISYSDVSIKGLRVCAMPNVLAQFQNIIPFGLLCASANKQDPFSLQSFSDGTCSLFILTKSEAEDIEATYG